MAIYFSSDTHFGHDREFIFGPRGFNDINEMNESIIKKFNSIISNDDELDLIMSDDYQNKVVKGIVVGIEEFLNELDRNPE